MSGSLNELGRSAAGTKASDVPTEVLDAMRGLHLARAGLSHGHEDAVLGGRVAGVAEALWDAADGKDLDALCAATAIGVEVGARAGLSRLYASADSDSGLVADIAIEVGRAWLLGRAPALDAFEARMDAGTPLPLHGALSAYGSVWLGRSLALATGAGNVWTNVAVEGVHEILNRHIRASEKRLRPDQIERISLQVNGWTAVADAALPAEAKIATQVGRLVATHERNGAGDPDGAAAVAERTEVHADLRLTVKGANALALATGGVIGGMTSSVGAVGAIAGGLHVEAIAELLRARPDRALRAWLRRPGTLEGATAEPWALPVEVKLYTTRGGWWPERRMRPEGTLTGRDLRLNAVRRWSRGDAERVALADALMDAPPSRPATAWIKELRG